MDKYQQAVMQHSYCSFLVEYDRTTQLSIENDSITVTQQSVPKTNYLLKCVSRGEIIKKLNGQDATNISRRGSVWKFNIDFNNKELKKIQIEFVDKLADDLIIKVNYIDADKAAYEKEQAEIKRQETISKMKISHAVGDSLVNIYFQPCNDNITKTVIYLHRDGQKIGTYNCDNEISFKSVCGLAYGKYEFEIEQFDKNGNLIIKSDMQSFTIKNQQIYNSKNVIYN